jgi:hypothetical protein
MWGIPAPHGTKITDELRDNKLFQTMADCQIVLRFFAFRDENKIRGSVKRMLDRSMERFNKIEGTGLRKLELDFKTRLEYIHMLFGDNAFELPVGTGDRHSRPLFDALMIAMDRLWGDRALMKKKKGALHVRLRRLLESPKTYELVVGRPNTADAVKKRIRLVERAFRSVVS